MTGLRIPAERDWKTDPFVMPYKAALAWAAMTGNVRLESYAKGRRRGVELNHMPYQEYLKTPEWRATRELALARARDLCEDCHTAEPSEVHHLTYERRGDELATDIVAICRQCHEARHHTERNP